jgi:chemotaxis protein methyltransferase CheR
MSNLTPEDVDAVCNLVDELCGICWDASKGYLIESRLREVAEREGCKNYCDLVKKVRANVAPGLRDEVIDAVTTNETLWFRDNSPFEAIKYKALPEIIDEKAATVFPKRIRLWSAACSTGQEPYSIALAIAETIIDYQTWDIQILGTDISPSAVAQASRGIYSKLEIGRGMPPEKLSKFFTPHEGSWKIKDEIRAMCLFKPLNLLQPFTEMGPYDVIFCRNVAIYFGRQQRTSLFRRLAERLNPNGWIFAGSSESLADIGPEWHPQHHCRSNCYRPRQPRVAESQAVGVR